MPAKDYQPVSLARMCNCGLDVYKGHTPPIGKQTFHGLPFTIGNDKSKRIYVGFGPRVKKRSNKAITIPIRRTAYNLLFAHTLIETEQLEGEAVGRTVAEYEFAYADGKTVRVPIRERFEVGWFPLGWGHYPFHALPDQQDIKFPRDGGKWADAGRRQTEADQGWPKGYYIWCWKNPRPRQKIASVTIHPTNATFIVAAITSGHLNEHPLTRDAGRDIKVTLLKKQDAERPFDLDVEVNRGYSTYVYPLPESDVETFLGDDFKGWGEKQNPASSPVHCEIAAIPSATISVRLAGKLIGQTTWDKVVKRKRVNASPRVRVELIDGGRNWVHTTVIDDETNKPVPCRVHFRSAHGVPYAPHGHHAHVNSNIGTWHNDVGGDVRLGQISYAYIDGKCQGWLPRGEVIVDIARGYEYEPIRKRIEIRPGQRELSFRLKRGVNLNAERYFSGDTHVHFLSTQGSHLEGAAEGLNVVNLLLSQWGSLYTNTEEFTGKPSVTQDGWNIVYASQENRQHMLGHLSLLGLKEPVMPWCTGGPSEGELAGSLETTLSAWADECHAQGGTVIIPHLPVPNCEPAALIATGRADAVEMLAYDKYFHDEYYRFLNCGYRLPLVGGTDKMTADVPVGICRTYVHIPPNEPFNYDSWCKALRTGNTFLSSGPMIRFTVNGEPVGSTIHLSGNGGSVELRTEADSIFPIHTLQIVQQGQVVAATEEPAGTKQLSLRATLKIEKDTWLAARCAGPGYDALRHHDWWSRGVFAHTSPIYLTVGDRYDLLSPADAQYMLTLVEGGLTYLREMAPQRRDKDTTHHHSHEDHQAFLESPFKEAMAAIHKRMHQLGIPH